MDLVSTLAKSLDPQLTLPLLDFLEDKQVSAGGEGRGFWRTSRQGEMDGWMDGGLGLDDGWMVDLARQLGVQHTRHPLGQDQPAAAYQPRRL